MTTATDFITVNGIELHNNLDIVVDYNVPPAIVNATLQSPGTFTITFQNAIDASSVDINDFAINGIVYTGTTSVSGAVVTLSTSGIFATDEVNTVSIVGEVLDLLGNAANIGHSSSTTSMENMQIMASVMLHKTTYIVKIALNGIIPELQIIRQLQFLERFIYCFDTLLMLHLNMP